VETNVQRATHDLVGRCFENSALSIGAGIDAEDVSARWYGAPRAALRVGGNNPGRVKGGVRRVPQVVFSWIEIRWFAILIAVDRRKPKLHHFAVIDDGPLNIWTVVRRMRCVHESDVSIGFGLQRLKSLLLIPSTGDQPFE